MSTKSKLPGPALRKIMLWLLVLFLLILAAGVAALTAVGRESRESEWERSCQAIEERLKSLDNSLSSLNLYLAGLMLTSTDVQDILTQQDSQKRNAAARQLQANLVAHGELIPGYYNFFFYDSQSGVEVFCYDSVSDYNACTRLRGWIREQAQAGAKISSNFLWEPVSAGKEAYLLQCNQLGSAMIACWTPCNLAFSFLSGTVPSEESFYTVLDKDGTLVFPKESEEIFMSGERDKLGRYSQEFTMRYGDLTMLVVDRPSGYQKMLMLFTIFFLVTLGIVAGFAVYTLTYFQRYIQQPFQRLQDHVNDFASTRKEAKRKGFAELNMAMAAFDSLVDQLNELKIEQYEEKIYLAKTQLEFFQLQIKPHFFVNAFSILHGMAQKKEYARIQQFCITLSDYVRYLFRDGLSMVSLEDELKVVRDYLDIQNIRYRAQSALGEDIPPELLSVNIPPLLLLTFVENAVKHSVEDLSMLAIFIQAQPVHQEDGDSIRLTVSGNCSGFSQEDLAELNAPEQNLPSSDGLHVGVENVRKRLSLMYGVEFQLHFSNRGESSVVEIVIPNRPDLHS